MSEMTRRDVVAGSGAVLAMFGALGAVEAEGQAEGQAGGGSLGASRVFPEALKKQPNGSERWQVVEGTVATGEAVAVHESVVPEGTPKSTEHVNKHSELVMVAEGTLGFRHDGVEEMIEAGSVAYVAYGASQLLWNAGKGTARYFVVRIGGDTKKG